jgi:GlpG protein
MIRLVILDNPRLAQAFIDYMASRDIEVRMMSEGGGQFSLWLTHDENQVEAEAELQQFLHNPTDKKYFAASWTMAETRHSVFYAPSSPGLINIIRAKAGHFTLGIMFVSVFLFLLQILVAQQTIFNWLHFPASQAQEWQIWRWFSHALLHFSVLHIVFNLLWWWYFGGDIEKRLGSLKLAVLFLVAAAGSGMMQYWLEGAYFGGLSGVVYALVGFVWIIGWKRPQLGLSIHKPLLGFMLIWLVLGFVQPFIPIANGAHLAGLVIGLLLGCNEIYRTR